MSKTIKSKSKLISGVIATVLGFGMVVTVPAQAADWGFSIHIPGLFYWNDGHYRNHRHDHSVGYDYYPSYNPVVRRDVQADGHYHRDGTLHTERTVEDRHDSYYSPGRNEAITRPRTTVEEYRGPGYNQERERTSWIGADGRPHSTTIDRVTTVDRWGNTHTDNHVTLKNRGNRSKTQPENKDKDETGVKKPKTPKVKHPKARNR